MSTGVPAQPAQAADVEEGLVDRQPLDEGRGVGEHFEHRLARLGVRRHARLHDDGAWAQPARLARVHRGADAVRLGFVARGEHDSHPDDDRAAAQARVVALLDRRVEGIEVRVEDCRRSGHEHMFAQG